MSDRTRYGTPSTASVRGHLRRDRADIDRLNARTNQQAWPIKSVGDRRTFQWSGTLELLTDAAWQTVAWDAPTEENPLPPGWAIRSLSEFPDFAPDLSDATDDGNSFTSVGSDVLQPDDLGFYTAEVHMVIAEAAPPAGVFLPTHSGLFSGAGGRVEDLAFGYTAAKVATVSGLAIAGPGRPFYAAAVDLAAVAKTAVVQVYFLRHFNAEEFVS